MKTLNKRISAFVKLQTVRWTDQATYRALKQVQKSKLFDYAFYQQQLKQELSHIALILHYLKKGWKEGKEPQPLFSQVWYQHYYPDVREAKINPFLHYLQHGAVEGRIPHPLFDAQDYLKRYKDVEKARINPLQHYLRHGFQEGRTIKSLYNLFDQGYYQQSLANVSNVKVQNGRPYVYDYITRGQYTTCNPHVLFDNQWYQRQVPEEDKKNLDGLSHYIVFGWREEKNPHVLFDTRWYLKQHGFIKNRNDLHPLRHYIDTGGLLGRSPHPAFDSGFYLRQKPELLETNTNPLLHYLKFGHKEHKWPNVLFDNLWYRHRYASQLKSREVPLIHYLTKGAQQGCQPSRFFSANTSDRTSLVDSLSAVNEQLLIDTKPLIAQRSVTESFDEDYQAAFIAKLRRQRQLYPHSELPLISIIMPTYNRVATILRAIESVQAQTYTHWELLIVDDGSTDGTVEQVKNAFQNDQRISITTIENSGVSYARNRAMEKAKGTYFAYLDSDNSWWINHLEILLEVTRQEQVDSSYSAIQMLRADDEVLYRYHEYDAENLRLRNFIDLNAFFHHRKLYDQLGGFDEALLRTVDWDLILRYCQQSQIASAPVVTVTYDDTGSEDRLTIKESPNWRYQVMNKHLVSWDLKTSNKQQPDSVVTIVIPVLRRLQQVVQCLQSIQYHSATTPFEIIVMDDGRNEDVSKALYLTIESQPHCRYIYHRAAETSELAFNLAIEHINSPYIVLMQPEIEVNKGWLECLLEPLQSGSSEAVSPTIITPDERIYDAGWVCSERSSIPYPIYRGERSDQCLKTRSLSMLGGSCFAISRQEYVNHEGLQPVLQGALSFADLCLRMSKTGKRLLQASDAKLIYKGRLKEGVSVSDQKNREIFIQQTASLIKADDIAIYQEDQVEVVGWMVDGYQEPITRWIPQIQPGNISRKQSASIHNRLIRIKVPCPDESVKMEWGDYHFARSLGMALSRLGYRVKLDFRKFWGVDQTEDDEITLVLRGRGDYPLSSNTLNLMWMISHPTMVEDEELNQYDHIFVASQQYSQDLKKRLTTSVSALLQCTDPAIFYPAAKDSSCHRPLLFVGNSRNEYRGVVKQLVEGGFNPCIYGTRWEQFIPANMILGHNIDNNDLGRYYRSADIVFNDHWQDMKEMGFVSNRIFDSLACGAPLVSDFVEGLPDHFQQAVLYFDQQDIESCIEQIYAESISDKQQRLQLAREVVELHSFDARAKEIDAVIQEKH